jgi:hypothetical protein
VDSPAAGDVAYSERAARPIEEDDTRMARTWLSIRVELVSGRGTEYWPRPGRIFAPRGRVMVHMVAAATGKDQETEKVHTLRS